MPVFNHAVINHLKISMGKMCEHFSFTYTSPLLMTSNSYYYTFIVSQGSTNNGMNLRSGSRFYTPATPNTCFDPMNITDCINSSKETFTEQSLFIFQLPGKCYGNILSMQMCLLVDVANIMLSLPIIRVTLYVQDGDHIIYSNNMVNISDMELERMCQRYPEFMGFICCFNYTFNVMLNHTDSTFIGLETLQNTVRLIHSKILSNVTICLNGLSMQNFPSCNCYLSEIFLLTVRAEIGENDYQLITCILCLYLYLKYTNKGCLKCMYNVASLSNIWFCLELCSFTMSYILLTLNPHFHQALRLDNLPC